MVPQIALDGKSNSTFLPADHTAPAPAGGLPSLRESSLQREDAVRAAMARLTKRYVDGETVNVRALGQWTINGYYAMPDDFELMVRDTVQLDELGTCQGIYCTLNPCVPALGARGRITWQGHRPRAIHGHTRNHQHT